MNFNISKERLLEGINIMNSFGTRLTGSKGHNNFVSYLKKEITENGQESKIWYRRSW